MNSMWNRFFKVQRQLLGRATENSEAGVFADTAEQFAEQFALASVHCKVAATNGAESTIYRWDETTTSGKPADRAVQHVSIANSEREHRFELTTTAQANTLPDEIAHAICSTLVSVVELHDEFDMHLADARGGGDELGHATVNADGTILHANEHFFALLRRSEPEWDAHTLPMPLDQSPTALRHGMTWKGLFFYVEPNSAHIRLRVRPDRRLPDLSPRELEVAQLIASGMTFKEVSRQLEMAPSTASTHLYKVYDKLGINRRSALVEWLNENADALASAKSRAR